MVCSFLSQNFWYSDTALYSISCTHTHTHTYACTHAHTHAHTCTCTHTCTHTHAQSHAHTCTCTHTCTHTHAHTHMHTRMHAHMHTHMHTQYSTCTSDDCECAVKLYSQPNFQGHSREVIHTQNARLANEGFDDQAASAKVVGTCSWLFYDSDNFVGNAYLLYPGEYYSNLAWGAQGMSLSSLHALPPQGTVAIALFDYYNFGCRMVILHASVEKLQTVYGFDNKASSALVVNSN